MNDQSPKLPRKPFGYDPVAVERMLSERDAMLGIAERRIREAEARALRSEEMLKTIEASTAELRERAAATPPQRTEEAPPLTPEFMTEELSKIVMAAEETTSQILERARISTRDQIMEADRIWREVHGEVVRFSAWRDEADAVVRSMQSSIDRARVTIESLSDRIRDALAPAVEAMIRVDEGLNRFSAAATVPSFVTPNGLEAARTQAEMFVPSEEGPDEPIIDFSEPASIFDDDLTGSAELDAFASGELDREVSEGGSVLPAMTDELRHHFQASGSLIDDLDALERDGHEV